MNIPKWMKPKNEKDILHYIIVYGVLAAVWTPMMTFFGNQITPTVIGGFLVFYVTDKLAHHVLKVD